MKHQVTTFKTLLGYKTSEYFNSEDYFLMYDNSLRKYHLTQLELYGGGWYSLLSLQFKMTSVPCVNYNELVGKTVLFKGTPVLGTLTGNVIDENMGVLWDSGMMLKEHGMPLYWNRPKDLLVRTKLN